MTPDPFASLPYRPNVGAALFNRDGLVLVARRVDLAAADSKLGGEGRVSGEGRLGIWQMPQGGIDEGEDPRTAVLRELREEIGTDRAEIIAEHPDWLSYDLPPHLLGRVLGGRYRGQRQRWFALRFTGSDDDIRLDLDPHPEFDAWKWLPLSELPRQAVGFKQPIYSILATSFAPCAVRLA